MAGMQNAQVHPSATQELAVRTLRTAGRHVGSRTAAAIAVQAPPGFPTSKHSHSAQIEGARQVPVLCTSSPVPKTRLLSNRQHTAFAPM